MSEATPNDAKIPLRGVPLKGGVGKTMSCLPSSSRSLDRLHLRSTVISLGEHITTKSPILCAVWRLRRNEAQRPFGVRWPS
jgi:hypothetical protein